MLKKILLLAVVGVMLSGCFMSPLAFIGPATSGFSTASLMQTGATSTANYLIKKSTGKTIARHVYDVMLTRPSGAKLIAVEGTALVRAGISTGCF